MGFGIKLPEKIIWLSWRIESLRKLLLRYNDLV